MTERSLILGASGGIGSALVARLQGMGEVVGLSRSGDGFDITDEASVAQHLGALDGPFDRIIVATGALEIDGAEPEKTLRALDPEAMAAQFRLNTIGPALAIKHAMPLMPRDGRSVLAVLSARVGSIGDNRLGGWVSYRAAKSAVNQVVRVASIELAPRKRPPYAWRCIPAPWPPRSPRSISGVTRRCRRRRRRRTCSR